HALGHGQLERLAHPGVAVETFADVQRLGRHLGTHRLDDGVTPEDHLGRTRPSTRAWSRPVGPAFGRGRCRLPRLGMPGSVLRRRGRSLALQRPTALAAGADHHALLGALFAHRALAPRVAGHQRSRPGLVGSLSSQRTPSGLSSTMIPAALSWSRRASAVAKSLLARAAWRCSSRAPTKASTTSRSRSPLLPTESRPTHGSANGSRPRTPSIARTEARLSRNPSRSPAESIRLPSRTVSNTT